MQWVAGVETDLAYTELAPQALPVRFRDTQIRVCALDHLRAMKRAAGRPQDLTDLERLGESFVSSPGYDVAPADPSG